MKRERICAGIDIGADAIQVATSNQQNVCIPLTGDWHIALRALLGDTPIVALEPTGRHYAAPVIAALPPHAVILQTDHNTTKRFRLTHVSQHKTDRLDATALLAIAQETAAGRRIIGVHPLTVHTEQLTNAMRAAILAYSRHVRDRTRSINRLRAFAHGVWPSLSTHLQTYRRALSVGAVTPAELHALIATIDDGHVPEHIAEAYHKPQTVHPLRRLVAATPSEIAVPPEMAQIILREHRQHEMLDYAVHEAECMLIDLIHHPYVEATTELWRTVPRNSTYAIATLHAAAHARAHLLTGDRLRGVIGAYPQRHSSGSTTRSSTPMRGYRPARHATHLWTMALVTMDNPIAEYYRRLTANGHGYPFQAAKGKLLRVLAGIATTGTPCRW